MNCPLCSMPLVRDLRSTKEDAAKCHNCGYQLRAPKGYLDALSGKCAGPGCEEPLPPQTMGRPRMFHAGRCQKAASRQRLKSEDLTEVESEGLEMNEMKHGAEYSLDEA